MVLQAIKYTRGSLSILDQLRLPHTTTYVPIPSAAAAWRAIRSMQVRGAPAIAIVAALSLAVELAGDDGFLRDRRDAEGVAAVVAWIEDKLAYLETSRPTAVNLADAVGKLRGVVRRVGGREEAEGADVVEAYVKRAEEMLEADVRDNEAIGRFGAEWIVKGTGKEEVSVLTHCNTGSLATAGYGTALGVIRTLRSHGRLRRVYCTETRPYNQGSRLTAYELVHDEIPATLITDSMAGALMRLKGAEENVVAVVVGADRVAANGDTANKIGTYALAILARHHGVKFVVAAPRTTIDRRTESGQDITIEERSGHELTRVTGPLIEGQNLDPDCIGTVSTAASGIDVWNPAFDVTPAELIDAVVTECGVVEKSPKGDFNFDEVFKVDMHLTNGES